MRKDNISIKVLVTEVQIATSSRFHATVGYFSYRCDRNGNSQRDSRGCFNSNTIFLLLEETRVIFHLSITLIKNVMGFPRLDMSNSAFCSVQDN